MIPIAVAIALLLAAAVFWSRRRPHTVAGVWLTAQGAEFEMIVRFTQRDGHLEGSASMRGIFGSIETSLLGSIDAKGVVALAAISPAAAAGRISYTATLRSTGVLDGTVHVIGEQDHRVVLFKEPAQASPRANQAASGPAQNPMNRI